MAAGLIGVFFLTVGIVGFVPEVTTDYTGFNTWSNAHAHLFGVFQISVVHLAFFVLFGLAGLRLARSVAGSRAYLTSGGFLFMAVEADLEELVWTADAGFLIGSAGVALALLAAVSGVEPAWDRLLVASSRHCDGAIGRPSRK